MGELHAVSAECESLKTTLSAVSTECAGAKEEVRDMQGKVRNLEQVLEEMRRAAESRQEIERQHKEALECLRRRQAEQGRVRQSSFRVCFKILHRFSKIMLKSTKLD